MEKIRHKQFKDFFQHPKLQALYLSKEGRVLNSINNELFKINKEVDCYNYISFAGNVYKVSNLMAETFLEKPQNDSNKKLLVNHKDGKKWNDSLYNLEWVNNSQNILHAYRTGLRSDNTPILVKDLRTNGVERFYSLNECARRFKVSGANIFWHLKTENYGKLCFKYYILIREGQEWPNVGSELIGTYRQGMTRDIVVRNIENKKYYIFESIADASKFVNISPAAFAKRIRDHRSRGGLGYSGEEFEYFYVEHLDELPKDTITKKRTLSTKLQKRVKRIQKPIKVQDMLTLEVNHYASSSEYCKILGVKKNTFQKHIWANNGVWKNRFFVTYL